MNQIGVEDYADYIDQLQVNADEFSVLCNTILINVTAFFRDPEAWQHLRDEVVPALLAERGPDDPVRVWSAGCASGEEACSLAIALGCGCWPGTAAPRSCGGMRRDEAEGEHLLNLDIGLPVADLRPVVRSALSDGAFMEEVKLAAVNRRGREVVIRVVCSSLRANGGEPDGAILVMGQQEN